ncbi:MAG TPA: YhbY family RNA-binding protein [Candidatus Lokiarchaeia archaeon]|nr:YhbY family RNA-binding protein [Candidatus Lokiarchaeia archaeon]
MSIQLFAQVVQGPIHAQIGKNGITDGVVEQLRTLTKRNGMIKVSVQKALAEIQSPSEVALEVERLTGCFLVEVRGRTFILSKRRIPLKRKTRGLK